MARASKKRIGTGNASSITIDKVISYFEDISWFDFDIEEIEILPEKPPKEDSSDYSFFIKCISTKESLHHRYLKWFSYKYLQSNILELMNFHFDLETNLFVPNEDYMAYNGLYEYGRFLGKQEKLFIHGGSGRVQEADLTCKASVLFECGATSPESLVLPLITQAVTKVIWLPFPYSKGRNEEWCDFETPLKAFTVKLKDGELDKWIKEFCG